MEKFSKIEDRPIIGVEEETILFKGTHLDVIKYKNFEMVSSNDKIAILPYFIDEGTFLMRLEYVPSYQFKNRNKTDLKKVTNYLTVITGTIEDDESPKKTIIKELYEESGIVINNLFEFEIEGPFFMQKDSISQMWLCLLELPVNSYKQVKPPTDGTEYEKLSKCIRISIADIDQIVNNDLISKYFVTLLKNKIK